MNKLRQHLFPIMVAILLLLIGGGVVYASDISSATYFGTIVISNNSTAETEVIATMDLSSQGLIDNGWVDTAFTRTAMRNGAGADVPFMPSINATIPWCMWVPAIGADTNINYILYFGSDNMVATKYYFPGPGGMVVVDDTTLELSDNFTQTTAGYINTDYDESAIVRESYTTGQDAFRSVFGTNWAAQTFVINTPHTTDNVSLYLEKQGAPPNDYIVSIRATDATGNVTGADIVSVAGYDGTTAPGSYAFVDFTFATTNLTPGRYAIVIGSAGAGGDAVNRLKWGHDDTSPLYVGGNDVSSGDSGVTWVQDLTIDALFRVTAIASSNIIVEKDLSFSSYVSGSGNITSFIIGTADNLTATGVSSGNHTIITSIGDTPDFDTWASDASIAVNMGAGLIPALLLEEQELTADTASVTFSDIDDLVAIYESATGLTARHLIINVNGANDRAANSVALFVRLNGDSGNNYNYQLLYGEDAVDDADRQTGISFLATFNLPGANYANAFGGGAILFPNAFNTINHKVSLSLGGAAEVQVVTTSGRWANIASITDIELYANTNNLITGSTFQLAVVDERYLVEEANITVADNATFTGIPGDGNDLVAIGYVRSDRASVGDSLYHGINGDAVAGNYFYQRLLGSSGSTSATSGNSRMIAFSICGDTATANAFSPFIAFYPNYTGGNQTSFLGLGGKHETTTPQANVSVISGRWNNTAAITELVYYLELGTDFVAGSLVSLYRVPRHVIARVELASALPEVLFDNIPQYYSGLQLVISARTDAAALTDSNNVEINNDAVAANYNWQRLRGQGAGVAAFRNIASQSFFDCPGNTEGADEYSASILTFPQYANTGRHKHIIILNGRGENSVVIRSARWESLNAITDIAVTPIIGTNYLANSVFELVGYMPTKAFYLEVDSEVKAIADATADNTSVSVTDTSANWTFVQGIPYMEYAEITVNGTQAGYWAWEYAETFTDQSVNTNTGYPTFLTGGSDPDISANMTTFILVTPAIAPPYSVSEAPLFITANVTMTGNFTSGNVTTVATDIPGAAVIDAVAGASGTPNIWLWGILAGITLAMTGLFITHMVRQHGGGRGELTIRIIIATVILGLLVTFGKFDFWMLVVYLFIVLTMAVWSRHSEFSGQVSQLNLIGCLAMIWVGLTILNRFQEGEMMGAAETAHLNNLMFTQELTVLDIFKLPVMNFEFFTTGLPSLMRWDYTIFGGNAQIIQYLLYSINAVVAFIILGFVIGMLSNYFTRLR